MNGSERDQVFEHSYDGIQEYDNPLPGWWLLLFWITILFSVVYMLYYHFGQGPSIVDQYNADMLRIAELQSKELLAAGPITDATILEAAKNTSLIVGARQIFVGKCSPCHGENGEGKIGPNLTDDYWIHGGRPERIYATILEGVPEKGMISWKSQLRPGEIVALAAYVDSLRGTAPANPKPPQGDLEPRATPTPGS